MSGAPGESRAGSRCPICGKPAVAEHRPFCSRRCADIDLHRWLSGGYAIPGGEDQAASHKADEAPKDGTAGDERD